MASIFQAPETQIAAKSVGPDRILLHDISWELYERLRDEEANWGIRMTYDDGELELMSPSQGHGEIESRFPIFVTEVADVLDLKSKLLGTTTWKKAGARKAKEADACFYLANHDRVQHKMIDLSVDPPPDLVIEVEVSRSAINALNIYAAIGVPEIWRFDGQALHIHERQIDGNYLEVERSLSFPFLRPGEIVEWMIKAEEFDDDILWKRQIREWARVVLAPRLEPEA
jgi:Uma2 family endonuclease